MQKLTRTLCVSLTRFSRFFAAFSSALCLATSGAGCPGAWLCGHVCLKWCGSIHLEGARTDIARDTFETEETRRNPIPAVSVPLVGLLGGVGS